MTQREMEHLRRQISTDSRVETYPCTVRDDCFVRVKDKETGYSWYVHSIDEWNTIKGE